MFMLVVKPAAYHVPAFRPSMAKDACEPMFLSWFIALGPFLLLAARKPWLRRSLIAFAACQCLVHASVMIIQTVEARTHGVHLDFTDVVLFRPHRGDFAALLLARPKQSAIATQ